MSKRRDLERMFENYMAEIEAAELREHAMDMIDTFENDEIAQMIREGILSLADVEAGLRRRMYE